MIYDILFIIFYIKIKKLKLLALEILLKCNKTKDLRHVLGIIIWKCMFPVLFKKNYIFNKK